MPEELPAWWTWSICSTQWYFSSATASKPRVAPDRREARLEPGQALDGGVGADELVVVEHGQPVAVDDRDDGAGEVAVGPGLGGPRVDSAAYVSTSVRDQPSMVAIRSAPMPCGTKSVAKAVSGSIAQAPPSEAIGTRLIDSTPPAKIRSSQPDATRLAAWLTASSPLAQKRLSWTPATVSGKPAAIADGLGDVGALVTDRRHAAEHDVVDPVRVEDGVARPELVDQPDDQVDRLDLVQRAGRLARPRGVRMASYTNASAMTVPALSSDGSVLTGACLDPDCDTDYCQRGQGTRCGPRISRARDGVGGGTPRRRRSRSRELGRLLDELTNSSAPGSAGRNVALLHHQGSWCRLPISSVAAPRYPTRPTYVARVEPLLELDRHVSRPRAGDRALTSPGFPADAAPEDIALHRTIARAVAIAGAAEYDHRSELDRRTNRTLSDDDLATRLAALASRCRAKRGRYQVRSSQRPPSASGCSTSGGRASPYRTPAAHRRRRDRSLRRARRPGRRRRAQPTCSGRWSGPVYMEAGARRRTSCASVVERLKPLSHRVAWSTAYDVGHGFEENREAVAQRSR